MRRKFPQTSPYFDREDPLVPCDVGSPGEIMVQVLNVLALATKQIQQGRFGMWPSVCRFS